jgi:predicted ribosome quality control (RQC) complex YloA/Tae2 family protein
LGEPIDNLVLTRQCVEWSLTLVGQRLGSLTQENGDRFRLAFASESSELALVASLDPRHPWIGDSVRRWEGPRWSPDRFVGEAAEALKGRKVEGLVKEPADRSLRLDFGDGRGLAIELAPHHANLVLLGTGGLVTGSLWLPKSAQERLTPGRAWVGRPLPADRFDPFHTAPEAMDAAVLDGAAMGQPPGESLTRRFAGLSAISVELALWEHAATGRSLGAVLRDRLDSIRLGTAEVLIEAPEDSAHAAGERLLPWRPTPPRPGQRLLGRGPGATAASFYEARDAAERAQARIAALGGILRAELDRARSAERKVRAELQSFADPDRFRRMGEALLASLSFVKRSGDVVVVSDPYDPDGREISIPAPPHKSLPQVADDLFGRQRRFRRGLESAGARAEGLSARASRLAALLVAHGLTINEVGATALEGEMRKQGIPVGLVGPTRAARAAARVVAPRLDGVRMIASSDGWTILVGRTGRDNDRLTFKIAAPDDIWLHAAGVHGAHVVIRNPERCVTIPKSTLAHAARLALWFSDARAEAAGDVHWTRRKNVRRARGGAAGRVVLKRFETLRVSAEPPHESI